MPKKKARKKAVRPKAGHGGRRAGAGRPRDSGEMLVTFSVSVPLSLAQWVSDQADALGVSRSKVVATILAEARRAEG